MDSNSSERDKMNELNNSKDIRLDMVHFQFMLNNYKQISTDFVPMIHLKKMMIAEYYFLIKSLLE